MESDLDKWLRSKGMTTKEFGELVNCSRFVLWRVKKGYRVRRATAEKIKWFTHGEVLPREL